LLETPVAWARTPILGALCGHPDPDAVSDRSRFGLAAVAWNGAGLARAMLVVLDGATIGQQIDDLDAGRFVGRARELEAIEALLVDRPPANVVLLHGPGGIGKSSLVREAARRAGQRGWPCVVVEGRDLPVGTDGIDAEIGALGTAPHALVAFDSWEHASPLTGYLQSHVLRQLPAGWVAIVAGRNAPETSWVRDGWEHVTREIALAPFDDADALECVRRYGVDDEERAGALVGWAAGSPLALVLGARVGAAWDPRGPVPDEVIGPLVRRVIDVDVDEAQLAVLVTAAFARVTTPELLAAVLEIDDATPNYEWLATRAFAEPLGEGVALHALFAAALREHSLRHSPVFARDVRRKLADFAYVQSVRNGDALSYDLAELVGDPTLRWGFGWDRGGTNRIDHVRPGEADTLAATLGEKTIPEEIALLQRYMREAPDLVVVVRDRNDAIVGISISASTLVPHAYVDRAILGPWLADARARAGDADAVVWAVSKVVGDELTVRPLLGFGGVLRSGVSNPRYIYLPIDIEHSGAVEFSASIGGVHTPELDVRVGAKQIQCHIVDFGPGGMLGAQRAIVYAELGFELPPDDVIVVDGEAVRALLRDLTRDDRLAASSFATGDTVAERAASVRALVRDAVDRTFGAGARDEKLRAVMVAGYLERTTSHEAVAASLHMSRAVYFRTAREAVDRLAGELNRARSGPR
jgi:hypothetical protein